MNSPCGSSCGERNKKMFSSRSLFHSQILTDMFRTHVKFWPHLWRTRSIAYVTSCLCFYNSNFPPCWVTFLRQTEMSLLYYVRTIYWKSRRLISDFILFFCVGSELKCKRAVTQACQSGFSSCVSHEWGISGSRHNEEARQNLNKKKKWEYNKANLNLNISDLISKIWAQWIEPNRYTLRYLSNRRLLERRTQPNK